jgi:hypothetical protein
MGKDKNQLMCKKIARKCSGPRTPLLAFNGDAVTVGRMISEAIMEAGVQGGQDIPGARDDSDK